MTATATKTKSIVMTAEEVRMLPNKTQHRIPAKLPRWAVPGTLEVREDGKLCAICRDTGCLAEVPCPFQPGDTVYVAETYTAHWDAHNMKPEWVGKCDRLVTDAAIKQADGSVAYATPDHPLFVYYRQAKGDKPPMAHLKWMRPTAETLWAARHWLRIKSVGVQRVQEIRFNEDELRAEGMQLSPTELCPDVNTASKLCRHYQKQWNAKNGSGSWESNPWVWCLSFERVENPGKDR